MKILKVLAKNCFISLVFISLFPFTGHCQDKDKIRVQLKWFHQFQFAGYYAAIKKGYFNNAGLDVELVEGGYNINSIQEVVKGRAEYGVSNSELLLHRINHKPVVVIAAIFQHSPLVFIARKSKKIFTPQDLVGKNIKFTRQTRDIELHATLINEGVGFSKITQIEGPVSRDDYFNDGIDAISAYITNEPYYYHQNNIEYSIIKPLNYGIDFYGDCLFTSEKEIKNHPQRVKAFRKACLEGWAYAMKNKGEIIDYIKEEYGVKKTYSHLKFEAEAIDKLMLPELVEIGHINPGRWRHIADTFSNFNIIPEKYSIKGFIYAPDPKTDIERIKKSLAGFILITIIIFSALIILIFFNRRLQNEIRYRRSAEKSLSQSEEKFRNIFHQSSEGIILQDFQGNILDVNESALRIVGYSKNELLKLNIQHFILPEERPFLKKATSELMAKGSTKQVFRLMKKDNKIINISSSAGVIEISDKKIIMDVINDTTEKLKAENQLGFQAMILEQIEDLVIATDTHGIITYINQSLSILLKIDKTQIRGREIDLFSQGTRENNISRKIINETINNKEWRGETIIYKDDRKIHLSTRTRQIFASDNRPLGIVFISTDITGKKAAEKELEIKEKQLRQAQKIEAVGTLAGGIAHDFNNLLYIISGNSELLLSKLENKNKKYLINILEATNRGADLVKRLLAFSRKTESRLRPVSLNQEITRIRKMIDRIIPKMIEVKLILEKKEKFINADQVQIEQVLMNLCINAKDSMPEGGKLVIKTEYINYSDPLSEIPMENKKDIPHGDYILLSVSDTGTGMDTMVKERIFDPFFTTKAIGQGSGLGLSVIYGIIQSHSAYIECKTEKSMGTIFNILFPVTEDIPFKENIEKFTPALVSGSETILVVDDEKNIRELTKSVLERIGYKIITQSDAESAIKLYSRDHRIIDLIILDLGMPGMGGRKAIDSLLDINRNAKIIVASGYAGEGNIKDCLKKGARDYLVKPYSKNELSGIIRKVLDIEDGEENINGFK